MHIQQFFKVVQSYLHHLSITHTPTKHYLPSVVLSIFDLVLVALETACERELPTQYTSSITHA